MAIIALPTELIDKIAFYVTAPSNLLSLSLTCKQLLAIIIPNHLHFRKIRCDLRRSALWNFLTSNPEIGSRCRQIHIIREEPSGKTRPRLPPSFKFKSDDETISKPWGMEQKQLISCFSALEAAIRSLPYLENFLWRTGVRPWRTLYAALMERPSGLREIELRLKGTITDNVIPDMVTSPQPLYNLARLTLIERDRVISRNLYEAYARMLKIILPSCPRITELHIDIILRPCSREAMKTIGILFGEIKLPHLRRVTLEEGYLAETHEIFFRSHPNLERLHLKRDLDLGTEVIFAHLPRLNNLQLEWLPTPNQFSPDVLPRLTYFAANTFRRYPWADMQAIFTKSINLRTLVLERVPYWATDGLHGILGELQHLERLWIRWADPTTVVKRMREEQNPWLNILMSKPKLTHLASVETTYWAIKGQPVSPEPNNVDTPGDYECSHAFAINALCSHAPSLSHIHFLSKSSFDGEWAFVRRSPDGVQVEDFKLVKGHPNVFFRSRVSR